MPLSRQRCVEVAAPYRLRLIDYKSPSTKLFCHIMQLYICKKSRQTLLSGLFAVLLSFGMQCSLILLKFLLPAAYLHLSLGKLFKCFKVAHCGFLGESRSSFEKFLIHLFLLLAVQVIEEHRDDALL